MRRTLEELMARRRQIVKEGFAPEILPDWLYPFQSDIVEWATELGRAAIFADCGLGKTPMQLVWAQNVVERTNKSVLICTPLAVSYQVLEEAEKFGIPVVRCQDPTTLPASASIVVTNYERLHLFDASDFTGMVCDESSILKNFGGVRRQEITEFMRRLPYRLLCTATAAPNDYTELGTSSEALGGLGHMDMLTRFFRNEQRNASHRSRTFGKASEWRFKGHAEDAFWRWVVSWARVIRKPSDYGYEDGAFTLPPLVQREHWVTPENPPDGMLFNLTAINLEEQRAERRRTIPERCEVVADLVNHDRQALVWCNLNDEADELVGRIPGAMQVSGSMSDDEKEARLLGFAHGDYRVLVTKPKIGAWGLNLQGCNHVTFFPTHSYEQFYQGVRRCWRFGQDKPVTVDIVASDGEQRVVDNLTAKAARADAMFASLLSHATDALAIERREYHQDYTNAVEVPQWLQTSR